MSYRYLQMFFFQNTYTENGILFFISFFATNRSDALITGPWGGGYDLANTSVVEVARH